MRRQRAGLGAQVPRWLSLVGPLRKVVRDCGRAAGTRDAGLHPRPTGGAIAAEAQAVATLSSGTGLLRTATRPTALSQHCLRATRVPKTLADRTHRRPGCGLVGGRDLVAAALGAFVTFLDPLDPGTARAHYQAARLALARSQGSPGRVKCCSARTSPQTSRREGTDQRQEAPGCSAKCRVGTSYHSG